MEKDNEILEAALSDLITGECHHFRIKENSFYFYPVTLAMTFKISKAIKALNMNPITLRLSPFIEIFRLTEKKKTECCHLLSLYTTPNDKESFFDRESQIQRAEYFEKNLQTESLTLLMMYAITSDKTEALTKYLGIDKEQEKIKKIAEIKEKNNKNNISCGGKSIFGVFLAPLKALGYTDAEILYERPYTYLRLLIADKADSMYMSDDEMQSLPKEYGGQLLIADNANNTDDIEKMLRERGFTING